MPCSDRCVVMEYDRSNDFYREESRRGRKAYRCCECGDPITVGEVHWYATGKSDGDFWTYRTCAPCVEIRDEFTCNSWIFGQLWESVRDQLFGAWNEMVAIDCLAKLKSQAAIDKMREQYADYRGDLD